MKSIDVNKNAVEAIAREMLCSISDVERALQGDKVPRFQDIRALALAKYNGKMFSVKFFQKIKR